MRLDPRSPSDDGNRASHRRRSNRQRNGRTPLARDPAGRIDRDANRRIVRWLHAGGVTTIVYGGNANLYNMSLSEYPDFLDCLEDISPAKAWMLPSIGPDFGKALDQVAVLRERGFPTAMALPMASAATTGGLATGLRRLAEAFGRPLTAYLKTD